MFVEIVRQDGACDAENGSTLHTTAQTRHGVFGSAIEAVQGGEITKGFPTKPVFAEGQKSECPVRTGVSSSSDHGGDAFVINLTSTAGAGAKIIRKRCGHSAFPTSPLPHKKQMQGSLVR